MYIYIYTYIVTDLSKFVPRDLCARKHVVRTHTHALLHAHAHAFFTQTLCAQRPHLLYKQRCATLYYCHLTANLWTHNISGLDSVRPLLRTAAHTHYTGVLGVQASTNATIYILDKLKEQFRSFGSIA